MNTYLANDTTALRQHLDHCKVENKRLFAMHCATETIHGFVLGRFVSTIVVVVFVLIGGYFLAM